MSLKVLQISVSSVDMVLNPFRKFSMLKLKGTSTKKNKFEERFDAFPASEYTRLIARENFIKFKEIQCDFSVVPVCVRR
jgi:hypothetical protein